jgi:hypothetical protein
MNRPRQAHWWLALCAAGQMLAIPVPAQNSPAPVPPGKSPSVPAGIMPPAPQSPVEYFRKLLAMTPPERADYLTNRPPEVRERIVTKVGEYLALAPDERELRLRATELRWYLTPLFRTAPDNRPAALAQVPEDLRGLVNSRLERWDALPSDLQQELLANDRPLHYFAHVDPTNAVTADPGQQKIAEQFNQFFDLAPEEKQKTLNTLSDAERAQMEQTLQAFDKLPPAQRAKCIRAFAQFAGMSAAERADFLKNADRWSQLPPRERTAWRDLVAQVPLWPPVPQTLIKPLMPPVPPRLPVRVQSAVATNRN